MKKHPNIKGCNFINVDNYFIVATISITSIIPIAITATVNIISPPQFCL